MNFGWCLQGLEIKVLAIGIHDFHISFFMHQDSQRSESRVCLSPGVTWKRFLNYDVSKTFHYYYKWKFINKTQYTRLFNSDHFHIKTLININRGLVKISMQFVLLIGYGASIAKPNTIGRTLVHFEFSERHFNQVRTTEAHLQFHKKRVCLRISLDLILV